MADAQDTSSSTSNIIPFRPRVRAVVVPDDVPDDVPDEELHIVQWTHSGLGDYIRSGDFLEIDMMVKTVRHDGVFLVDIGGMPELRRVQRDILDDSLLIGDDRAPAQRITRDQLCVLGALTRHWRLA